VILLQLPLLLRLVFRFIYKRMIVGETLSL